MDFQPVLIDAMKAPLGDGIASRHMVTVVGELLTRRDPWRLTDDFVAFDDQARAIVMDDDPLASEQRDRVI